MDSGHDDKAFIKALSDSGAKFLIKRNLRRESREQHLAMARRLGTKQPSRAGKNIYRCILSHRKPEGLEDIPLFMVVEVVERLTDAKTGQRFLIPELDVSAWWTNLPEDEAVCIDLYHKHATSEQFHSELKSDMGLESLPSGKFATNALILNLSALAFNSLRFIGQEALASGSMPVKGNVSRRRLRSVLQDLIYVGCKFVRHANTIIVKFGRNWKWFKCFKKVQARC